MAGNHEPAFQNTLFFDSTGGRVTVKRYSQYKYKSRARSQAQMEKQIPFGPQSDTQELLPHEYPRWIIIFGMIIMIMFFYSLYLVPKYIDGAKKLRKADLLNTNHQYSKAIVLYADVLDIVPSSKKAKIGIAESYFSNDDPSDDETGLLYLKNVFLDNKTWNRISKIMPVEYQKHFEIVKKR